MFVKYKCEARIVLIQLTIFRILAFAGESSHFNVKRKSRNYELFIREPVLHMEYVHVV